MEKSCQYEQTASLKIVQFPTMTGNNKSPIGLKTEELAAKIAEARLQRQKALEENAGRIRKSYGEWLTDDEVRQILKAERENQICKSCVGLPCRKSCNPKFRQVIQPNDAAKILYIANSPCKYIRVVWEQNKLKDLIQAAGIPAKYEGLTFEDYEVDEDNQFAVKTAHRLLENLDQGAFFYGSFGVGKTMLAAIIAQEHLKRGRSVLFVKLPDLLRSVRATYSKESKASDVEVLQQIYNVPILILDDVKAVKQSKFAGDTLFGIIDARDNAGLQTIMTSNNTLKELAAALDNPTDSEATYDGSRIYDRCKANCFPIHLAGESRRI